MEGGCVRDVVCANLVGYRLGVLSCGVAGQRAMGGLSWTQPYWWSSPSPPLALHLQCLQPQDPLMVLACLYRWGMAPTHLAAQHDTYKAT